MRKTSAAAASAALVSGMLGLAGLSGVAVGAEISAFGGTAEVSGSVATEMRVFVEDPQFPGQLAGGQASVILNPEISWQSDDRRHYLEIEPYLRLDGRDAERSHFDLRTAFYEYIGDDFELLIGVNKVFWGVAESRHLVNIVNQIDGVEDLDEEDYLGEPMVAVTTQRDWGRVSLMVMPGVRERTFAGTDGRLRAPLIIDTDNATFDSDLEQAAVDVALRYEHFVGAFDIGLSYFYGTGREPRLLPGPDPTRLTPHYDQIHQAGIDAQWTQDAFLWKFEGIVREGQGDLFGALVAGLEYTVFQAFDTAADIGLIAELLYDGRDDSSDAGVPATIFDNDVFLGTRLALNDVQDTSALIGLAVDLDDNSTFLRVEAARRIGNSLKLELEASSFVDVDSANSLAAVRDDHFIALRLSYFF